MSTKAIDPVCGMTVEPAKAVGSSTFEGQAYYFCSRGCETKFDDEPKRYLDAEPAVAGSCCSTSGRSCC